jgi:predicted ester cyclase
MASIEPAARAFFEACESGKGWSVCREYCTPGATFSCQADALAEIKTLESYTDWMQGLFGPIPDGSYVLKAWGVDEARNAVVAAAVFSGTQTGDGGPIPPTGKRVEADYVYVMEFDGDKIRHMTKVWNADHSLRQLGWA